MGVKARSWLGWQLPLRSSDAHAAARIDTIDTGALNAAMAGGEVAVIPGFQGVADTGRVTTLGRGGSDTSAVAVADRKSVVSGKSVSVRVELGGRGIIIKKSR